jgi:hypothetical protein
VEWDFDLDDVLEAFVGALLAGLVLWLLVMPLLARRNGRPRRRWGR